MDGFWYDILNAYPVCYCDMFQGGNGHPATPLLGIPQAEFSPFHRPEFEHLRELALDQPGNATQAM